MKSVMVVIPLLKLYHYFNTYNTFLYMDGIRTINNNTNNLRNSITISIILSFDYSLPMFTYIFFIIDVLPDV